jgi:MHS family proline/betaine transporter-like MFS transporter
MQNQTLAAKLSPLDQRRAIIAASVGQFFELYDFSIYGFFAPEIGRAFFPAADALTSLVAAFATYGVGFVMRRSVPL